MKTTIKYIAISLLILIVYQLVLPNKAICQQTGSASVNMQIGDPEIKPYPFKPGDAFLVNTFPDTSSFLNGTYPIDDRGYAEFLIIGKIQVSKMTMVELKDILKATFQSYLRGPNLYIKPLVRVSLSGGYVRPGLYYMDYNTSIWEVIRMGGGPILEEGLYETTWQRDGDEVEDIIPYFEKGVSLKRMGFKSGDQLWTPTTLPRTFWDYTRDIMPILTFAMTIYMTYYTIQRDFNYLYR